MYYYKTKMTCSQAIEIELDGDTISFVHFIGGCRGNTQGVAKLVAGRKVDEVIALLEGTQCRGGTSCPDQLATALKQIKEGTLKAK